MNIQLVIMKPFGTYKRGQIVSDGPTVEKILSGPQASSVVRVTAKES